MVARIAKVMGSAYATETNVSVEFEYNGTIVYSGMVPTIIQNYLPEYQPDTRLEWAHELATFNTDTDITGFIPCRITVSNGTLFFTHIMMNYTSNAILTPVPNPPPNHTYTSVVPMEFFGLPQLPDGVSNTKKNNVIWNWRNNVEDQLGSWTYPVYSGETFSFDFFVDPNYVVFNLFKPRLNP
jgi:hypothetical protein